MIILTGLAASSVRPGAPVVSGHGHESGHVRAAPPALPADPAATFRRLRRTGGSPLLEELGLTDLPQEQRTALVRSVKSALGAIDPLARGTVKYFDLLDSGHKALASAREGPRPWIEELQTACGLLGDVIDVVTVTSPQLKENRFVQAVDNALNLGEMACKLVASGRPPAPAAQAPR